MWTSVSLCLEVGVLLVVAELVARLHVGAYTRPLFRSTLAHFVGYVGCMNFPQFIRQGDKGGCDQNGLG